MTREPSADEISPANGTDSFSEVDRDSDAVITSHKKQRHTFPLDYATDPAGGWAGWAGPLVAGAIALALRLPRLGQPHAMAFDETYYAKDALSLITFGVEHSAVDGADQKILDSPATAVNALTNDGSYVVHPPVGKWIIGLGEHLFGVTPFGWRIMMVFLGVASVVITARVARRIMKSNVAGTVAGLLLAFDGLHIVMSRTALLDTSLSFFILCAFAFLMWDRDLARTHSRSKGIRLTRVGLTVSLGLAMATKWSAAYYIAAFGVLMLAWDFLNRSTSARSGAALLRNWLRRDVLTALLMPIGIVAIYLGSWVGWFRSSEGWGRDWADTHPGANWMPNSLRSLIHYHSDMLDFHRGLTTPHSYDANPWGWPIMLRPTSFFYETADTCGTSSCSQEVIPLGNPLIWWVGVIALLTLLVIAIRKHHSAATAIVVAFGAGWIPWLFFQQRTVFTFYSVVFVPFTCMALALVFDIMFRQSAKVWFAKDLPWATVAFVSAVALLCLYFYPIYVAQSLPYDAWHHRMWIPSWI